IYALRISMQTIQGKVTYAINILSPVATARILYQYGNLSTKASKVIIEALEVIVAFIKSCQLVHSSTTNQESHLRTADDDSQDYGDWSGMEDLVIENEKRQAGVHLEKICYDALHRAL